MSMCFVSELMSAEHAGLSAAQASARDGGNYDSALTRVAGREKRRLSGDGHDALQSARGRTPTGRHLRGEAHAAPAT